MSDAGDDIAFVAEKEAASPVKVPLALQRVMASMCSGTESNSLAAKAAAVLDMKSRAFPKEGRAHRVVKPAAAQEPRRWQR